MSNFLDWKGLGYHAFPLSEATPGFVSAADAALWRDFEDLLQRARAGDSADLQRAIALYDASESWILSAALVDLMGDAGDARVLQRILAIAEAMVDPDYQVDMCRILAAWGRLSVVPLLLSSWVELEGYDDRDEIPELLSRLLEPEPGPIAMAAASEESEDFAALVMQCYEQRRVELGGDDTIVLRGARFDVRSLAETVLASAARGELEPWLRRRFEASTGIDCRGFYDDGLLQPLAVAAVVESFLEVTPADSYVEGVRYFFGRALEG